MSGIRSAVSNTGCGRVITNDHDQPLPVHASEVENQARSAP